VLIRNLLLATALFSVFLTLGTLTPIDVSLEILQEFGDILEPLRMAGHIFLLLVISLNNALKALGVIVLGIFFGLPPLLFICVNGFILGALISAVESVEGLGYVVASLVPHGVIEVPALLLATTLGFTVGWESLKWLLRRKSLVKSKLLHSLKLYLRWVLPGLIAAAIIEVFITPWVVARVGGM